MTAATKPRARTSQRSPNRPAKARLEARIDADLDDLIIEAADRLRVTKTTFIADAVREAALKVIARAEVTLMAPKVFDQMIASLGVADASPELVDLAALPLASPDEQGRSPADLPCGETGPRVRPKGL